ncbi:MAG TPA: hypothetical protein VFX44_08550 [Solirubrobacterales bacterium]|nr:hypothetical protein [Solirubrobacterales bacterium]
MPADALLDLPVAEKDALFALPERARRAILDSGEAATHAGHLARFGVTKLSHPEEGLIFIGPRKQDVDARTDLAARERVEQRQREREPRHHAHRDEVAAALRRQNEAAPVQATAVRPPASPPRARAREHRATSSRCGSGRASRGSPSGDPDEPEPPLGGTP